jgi:GMP reductase
MKIERDIKLDFSDVLMRPKRSELSSRKEVDLTRTFTFKHSGRSWTGIPVVVSNMDTTGTVAMALELQKHKMITCLHKFHKAEDIPNELDPDHYAVTIGIRQEDLDNLDDIYEKSTRKPHFICIDVPNGYSSAFLKCTQSIRAKYPAVTLIGGNVVTREMVEELILDGGLDIVKVGIGSGSVCTTRLKTGVGYPQFSAVMECSDAAHGLDGHIMSDGGIQVVGDIAKAIGGGADFVMCGSMFSGHDESGGELITDDDGRAFKMFYGMSSAKAMEKYYGKVANYRSAEGKVTKVIYKGPVLGTIQDICGGIRSCMTYIGAKKLKSVAKCATFILVNNQVNRMYGSA